MIYKRDKFMFYQGKKYVDLRSYEVQDAFKRKKPIRVMVGDEYMDLDLKQLKNKTLITKEPIQSKFYPDQKYYLWSYEWNPSKPVDYSNPANFKYK